MFARTKNSLSGYDDSDEFSAFTTPESDSLGLTNDIKQEVTREHASSSSSGAFLDDCQGPDDLMSDYVHMQERSCVQNAGNLSPGVLQKKGIEVNNNTVGPSTTAITHEGVVNVKQRPAMNPKPLPSHQDQYTQFLLQKQAEFEKQQEIARQQQHLEILKQEILRVSQLAAQAQQAHQASEEAALSQALQAQAHNAGSLPRLTADTVQGVINSLPPDLSSHSPDEPLHDPGLAEKDSVVPTSRTATGHHVKGLGTTSDAFMSPSQHKSHFGDSLFGTSDSKSQQNCNIPRSPVFSSVTNATPTQPKSPPTSLGFQFSSAPTRNRLLQSPVQPNVHLVPPQSPVRRKTPASPSVKAPVQRDSFVTLLSPVSQHQIPSSRVPTSPLTPNPSLTGFTPLSPNLSGSLPSTPTSTTPHSKSLLLPAVSRPTTLTSPQQSPALLLSPSDTVEKSPSVGSPRVTMQSILNNAQSTCQSQAGFQQSLLTPSPFSRGSNGPRLPTAQVRPMQPTLLPNNALKSVLKSPASAQSESTKQPSKTNKGSCSTPPKSMTTGPKSKPNPPSSKPKPAGSKISKSKRKKPSNSVTPISKTILPQNGISITHQPVSPQTLNHLQKSRPAPLIHVFPQQTQPSSSSSTSTSNVMTTSSQSPSSPTVSTMKQQSAPAIPLPQAPSPLSINEKTESSQQPAEDPSEKPSKSTRKAIKAFDDKNRRKAVKKNPPAAAPKVSTDDPNDITKNNIDKKTSPSIKDPDGFVYDPTDICRGLGNIPLKPSLLGDPYTTRLGVPRFQKRNPWQKFPLMHNRLPFPGHLAHQHNGQSTSCQEALKPQQAPLPQKMEITNLQSTKDTNEKPTTVSKKTETKIKLEEPLPVTAMPATETVKMPPESPTFTNNTGIKTPERAVHVPSPSPLVASPKTATHSQTFCPNTTGDECPVSSSAPRTVPVIPQSPPVRAPQPAFLRIPTPTIPSPQSPRLSSAASSPHTLAATNCPMEPFGNMSIESLQRPPLPQHKSSKSNPCSMLFPTSDDSYDSDLGNNVVVIAPQAGYNCNVPAIPAPQPQGSAQHGAVLPYHADLKSPDSGFNESCVSPVDVSLPVSITLLHSFTISDLSFKELSTKWFAPCWR